jgi:redox-sensitive bicupin YhaK (pirin superfamily)
MIGIRRSQDRGHRNYGWLDTFHTFSFGDYDDPAHRRFRALRVMNEDRIAPGQGFGTHPHRDMEIVTYVLDGALEHRDSMGHGEVLHRGEFQRMSAGTGITHSEFNPSATEPVHLYQIWLFPAQKGIEPSYEQRRFPDAELQDALRLVAAPDAADGALQIHQDARVYLSRLAAGRSLSHVLAPGRHAWLQILRGKVTANGEDLSAGDGVAVSEESLLSLHSLDAAELLLFDLA